jgi:hypothetical protein
MKKKLRIGVLLDSKTVPYWALTMFEKILAYNNCEIVVGIVKKGENLHSSDKIKTKQSLFDIYRKLENRFKVPSRNTFESKSLENIVPEYIEIKTNSTKLSDSISVKDFELIKSYELDVIIRLGFKILRGDILKASKYGIWSYHHGDNKVNRGGPAGVWEVFRNIDETGVTLQILTENLDGGSVLAYSYSSTNKLSINFNKNNLYWKAANMLPRELNRLYNLGEIAYFNEINKKNALPVFYSNELYVNPKNIDTLKGIFSMVMATVNEKINTTFFKEQWILLYNFNKKNSISKSLFRFKKLIPPSDRFWADPHIIYKNGKYFVFIEELIYKNIKGHISVFEINEKGEMTAPEIILKKDYHLSYPFTFEHNGIFYMIPETSENNTIELYECTDFPYKWELKKILKSNIKAVDTTILFHDNKCWMFANIKENMGASTCDELFLFYADSLLSDNWTEHPMNPIVSDVKSSRPAGSIIEINGNLLRPSQDCAKRYGYGIKINKIEKLNETEYSETETSSIYPNWDKKLKAVHTISNKGNLTFIDSLIKIRK